MIFLLERLAGLIAFSQGLKVYDALLMKRCLFDFERMNPRSLTAVSRPCQAIIPFGGNNARRQIYPSCKSQCIVIASDDVHLA